MSGAGAAAAAAAARAAAPSRAARPRLAGASARSRPPPLRPCDARGSRPPSPAAKASKSLAGDIADLVAALPAALLWSLAGIAALALGLAVNAYWQSRQRAALTKQREDLLDDIGLLSGPSCRPFPSSTT